MSWIAVGPAGVFATKSDTCYYLENSRGVINPTAELLSHQSWTNVIDLRLIFFKSFVFDCILILISKKEKEAVLLQRNNCI